MTRLGSYVVLYLLATLTVCAFLLTPPRVAAQTGDKAVFGTGNSLAASSAWVDASAFCGSSGGQSCTSATDFCSVVSTAISQLLTTLSPAGGVVDARGVQPPPVTGNIGYETCSGSPFPSSLSQTNLYPITLLLPAYTINLSITWTIPNNVRLVGVGFETNLASGTGCCTGAMIEMGPPPSGFCTSTYYGIAIEHLQISVQGTYHGIELTCPPEISPDEM